MANDGGYRTKNGARDAPVNNRNGDNLGLGVHIQYYIYLNLSHDFIVY